MKNRKLVMGLFAGLSALLAFNFATVAQAEDKKADPAGTWTWTVPGRNGGPERKMTLKLKQEGEKVTGKLSSPGRDGQATETEIENVTVKGEDIDFTVTREFNGNKMTSKYKGKLSGDTIKGKMEFDRNGETQSRDWEAKRQTEKTEKAEKKD
jgi:hypothetical protein